MGERGWLPEEVALDKEPLGVEPRRGAPLGELLVVDGDVGEAVVIDGPGAVSGSW